MTGHRMDLADYVRELTDTHTHVETYQTRSTTTGGSFVDARHVTRVPSLLAQLWANDTPSAAVEEGPRPGFASKPAARLDALDAAVRIDIAAARWVYDLSGTHPDPRHDTVRIIRQVHALTASAEPVTKREVEHDVRRWWTAARIVTGWDSVAWTPDNTCPQCGVRGTLKVRLADRLAMCTNDDCRVTWDGATIGLLADHIRAENDAERPTPQGRGPCWCPWPVPSVPDLSRLCPACGSARCRHALGLRLLDTIRESERMGA